MPKLGPRSRTAFLKKLVACGCQRVRSGGNHPDIYRGPNGKTFPVSNHPEYDSNYISLILREAGIDRSTFMDA